MARLERKMNTGEAPIDDFVSGREKQLHIYMDSRLESVTKRQAVFEKRIEELVERQGTDIAGEITKLEQNVAGLKEEDSATGRVRADIEKIEKAVNDWTKIVEEQVNVRAVMIIIGVEDSCEQKSGGRRAGSRKEYDRRRG